MMAMKKNVSVKIHFYQMNKISCATNGRNKKIVVMKMLILEFYSNYGILQIWVFRKNHVQNCWEIYGYYHLSFIFAL